MPDNTIQLYPGETIYIEVEQENGIIKSMTAVKENKNPAKTVTISLTQSVKKKVHELMMLKVSNPFPQKLVYEAKFFAWPENHWIESDVLPVESGLSGFESWPDIIISIGLSNWRLENK